MQTFCIQEGRIEYIDIVIYSQSINSSHEIIEAYCKKKVDPTLATSAEMILKK